MPDRFYLPGSWQVGDEVSLPAAEVQHGIRVLRLSVGDELEVFNGQGQSGLSELTWEKRSEARVRILAVQPFEPPSPLPLTVAFAPPKGDRFRFAIEKLTELGVDRIVPLKTARSVVDPRESKLDKLEQNIIAACKQCRRNWLPELSSLVSLPELIAKSTGNCVLYGDQHGNPLIGEFALLPVQPLVLVVGPEGGLTDEEHQLLNNSGAKAVRVGSHVLRVETAAIALAALAVDWSQKISG